MITSYQLSRARTRTFGMRASTHSIGAARGFTLLELLVEIAIFAVLSVFAYQGLSNFLVARVSLERHDEEFLQIARGFDLLQQDLESAVARPVRDSLRDPLPSLDGLSAQGILLALTRHTAWAPLEEKTSDLKRIECILDRNSLVRRSWFELDRVQDSTYSKKTISTEIANINFRYFREGEWIDVWPEAKGANSLNRLPDAVQTDIEFNNGRAIHRIFLLSNAG